MFYRHLMDSAFTAERSVLCLHAAMHLTQSRHPHTHTGSVTKQRLRFCTTAEVHESSRADQ